MAYGELKVDSITFTDGGTDTTVSVSGLVQNPTFSGDITVTGTISGDVILGGTTVSGATVTGTAGQFGTVTGNTAGFTTVTGTTVTGTTAQFTSVTGGTAGFTTVTGTTVTGTTANFITVSGTAITGNTAGFTTVTGTTVTGTTANFVTVSGTAITGNTAGFTTVTGTTVTGGTGNFISISATTTTITSGVFASGTAAAPSVSVGTTDNGLYSPGTDQVAISTNGTGRLFVESTGSTRIEGTGGPSLIIKDTDSASGASTSYLRFWGSDAETGYIGFVGGSNYYINNSRSSGAILFRTEDTERLRITADGKLGLGTSSPSSTLDVEGIVTAKSGAFDLGGFLNKYGADTNSRSWWLKSDTHGYGDFAIRQSTTQTGSSYDTKLLIDSSGNVGIGTTSPSFGAIDHGVHIYGSGAQEGIRLETTDGSTGILEIYAESGGNTLDTRGSGYIRFNSVASEWGRWDSSGRLLVGTSSSRANFFGSSTIQPSIQVETLSSNTGRISAIANTSDTNPSSLILGKTRATSLVGNTVVQANDWLGFIQFLGADGTKLIQGAAITAAVDGTPGANDMPGRLGFSTTADGASSPTERMRISSTGFTATYCDSGNNNLSLGNAGTAGTTNTFLFGVYGRTGTVSGGTISVSIYTNGNIENTNNSYTGISDIKLKENIVDANSQWDDIKALQVRNYNFKEGQTHTQIGLIAQEVELVSPGLVTESPDRDEDGNDLGTVTKSVNYSVLYMKAVKALQEAMERIETLEQRLNDAGIN